MQSISKHQLELLKQLNTTASIPFSDISQRDIAEFDYLVSLGYAEWELTSCGVNYNGIKHKPEKNFDFHSSRRQSLLRLSCQRQFPVPHYSHYLCFSTDYCYCSDCTFSVFQRIFHPIIWAINDAARSSTSITNATVAVINGRFGYLRRNSKPSSYFFKACGLLCIPSAVRGFSFMYWQSSIFPISSSFFCSTCLTSFSLRPST